MATPDQTHSQPSSDARVKKGSIIHGSITPDITIDYSDAEQGIERDPKVKSGMNIPDLNQYNVVFRNKPCRLQNDSDENNPSSAPRPQDNIELTSIVCLTQGERDGTGKGCGASATLDNDVDVYQELDTTPLTEEVLRQSFSGPEQLSQFARHGVPTREKVAMPPATKSTDDEIQRLAGAGEGGGYMTVNGIEH
ncbi:unnamed protein product [Fusarium langsethiae]|nr:unnamed protein product [Fusarium langsethiae]